MLLPFAGFLYGSLLNLEVLQSSGATIWLLYFVFPVQTLMPLAFALSGCGLAVFLIGAFQIYGAKWKNTGLVTGGVYRFTRNPQYVGLVVFSTGILLIWGRILIFLFFFLLIFTYYLLSRREEANCRRLFGDAYEEYARTVPFMFPGDRILAGPARLFERAFRKKRIAVLVAFALWMTFGLAVSYGTALYRLDAIETPAYAKARLDTGAERSASLYLLRGFDVHIAGRLGMHDIDAFWKKAAETLASSGRLAEVVSRETLGYDCLLAFPLVRTVREKKIGRDPNSWDVFILVIDGKGRFDIHSFSASRRQLAVVAGIEVEDVIFGAASEDGEMIRGSITLIGREGIDSDQRARADGLLNIYLTSLNTRISPINRLIEVRER